jgi:flagellar operon protein
MVERVQMPITVPVVTTGAGEHRPAGSAARGLAATSFQSALRECLGREPEVSFSEHAASRLQQRKIVLDGQDVTKLEQAVSQAERKGGKESLILLNELAFIVRVKDRTVVTALDTTSGNDKVFTNIDSVVVAR